jgi:hypothetical protein
MKKGVLIVVLVMYSLTCFSQPVADLKDFKCIFNGKNLKGWHVSRSSHQGTTGNFFVEDKSIVLKQKPFGQGGVLLTDKLYKNFELYLEVKIDSFCNGGIFLRSTESGQAYQIELAAPGATGSLFGEALQISKPVHVDSLSRIWRPGNWNSFLIRMTGDNPTISLWINGVFMWTVMQPLNDFVGGATAGLIGLQSHWTAQYQAVKNAFNMPGAWRPDAAHRFRNIHIKELL